MSARMSYDAHALHNRLDALAGPHRWTAYVRAAGAGVWHGAAVSPASVDDPGA